MTFHVIAIEAMPAQQLYDIQGWNDPGFDEVFEHFGGKRLELAEQIQLTKTDTHRD